MKKTILSGVVAAGVASLMSASTALAWGSCGRGPWQSFPVYNKDRTDSPGPHSYCSCGNGMNGMATGSEWRNGIVYGLSGPANGGVGVELEAWSGGQRVFVPVMAGSLPFVAATYSAEGLVPLYGPGWSDGYEFTWRFRSVCLTNLPSLFDDPPPTDSPWFY